MWLRLPFQIRPYGTYVRNEGIFKKVTQAGTIYTYSLYSICNCMYALVNICKEPGKDFCLKRMICRIERWQH
jgi:hypothetical protein